MLSAFGRAGKSRKLRPLQLGFDLWCIAADPGELLPVAVLGSRERRRPYLICPEVRQPG